MKIKQILYITIALLFVVAFFFKVIPIPVNSIDGIEQGKFIFGGFYFTSILYELSVHNLSSLFFASMFGVLALGINLIEVDNGYNKQS